MYDWAIWTRFGTVGLLQNAPKTLNFQWKLCAVRLQEDVAIFSLTGVHHFEKCLNRRRTRQFGQVSIYFKWFLIYLFDTSKV